MDAERQTLEVFVVPNRRDRWITGLDNPKRRRKILDRLCHHDDWRTNLARTTAPTGRRPEHLAALLAELRALGAPAVCHVMSERADCEARSMPLPEALEALSDDGCALLVCPPRRTRAAPARSSRPTGDSFRPGLAEIWCGHFLTGE